MPPAAGAAPAVLPADLAPLASLPAAGSRRLRVAVALFLLGGAFVADFYTGNEASSSLYYLAAVGWAAWFLDLGWGIAAAVAGGAAWLTAYLLVPGSHTSTVVLAWNVVGELVVYGGAATSLAWLRRGTERTRALAEQLLVANEQLDREARAVGRLQTGMLPVALPHLPGHEWSVHYETSTRAGGDYYDFAALPDDRTAMLVADASGHGPAAAVLMAVTRAVFQEVAPHEAAPAGALAAMNRALCRLLPSGWFVTAAYLVYDPRADAFEYSLAGHPPPLVVRREPWRVETLEPRGGLMLGPFPGATFAAGRARLGPGDALVLCTDGLAEAADPAGALLGEEAVATALAAGGPADARTLRDRLLARVRRHRGGAPASDDLTLLVLRRFARENAGEPAASTAEPPTS